MNQVGIGQLKYANKTEAPAGALGKNKVPVKLNARPQQSPKGAGEANQEGKLSVDILQREDRMIIICPIAGVEKPDIKVSIQDDVLTIRGERKEVEDMPKKDALVQELFWGVFSRSIVLPDHIDRKNINARVHEHMLIITIPKTEDFKSRIIHIEDDARAHE
ncbi:MAG: Hsp20/alpha crystallin family protein [Candidatus Gracilibacteria bacterium]|jgi:HSP20 family molecular chaperone IbpA